MEFAVRRPGLAGWLVAILAGFLPILAGCEEPHRPDSLPVGFEAATTYSSCLVASVVMAANYTEERARFKVKDVIAELKAKGADETRVQDLKDYLAGKGLDLVTLAGGMSEDPYVGLGYWLRQGRYPVVCVINRMGTSPDFNHAVVVIGIEGNQPVERADRIYYLDPSADSPLFTCSGEAFETMWARGRHAMLVVTRWPAGATGDQKRDESVSPEVKP
jgi:hypothetical protein